MTVKEKIQARYSTNKKLVDYLMMLVNKYPEQRFGQILSNYILPKSDPFFEESVDTLERVQNSTITIKVGTKFKQAYPGNPGLVFEILSIDKPSNSLKVKVTNSNPNYSWEENWDGLDKMEKFFLIGEYSML